MTPTSPQPDYALYELLPAIHRVRDAALGYPLRSLLAAISDQANELSQQIEQRYDDWFIETCEDYLIPFFADLVGVALGPAVADSGPAAAAARRRQVADALSERARKGTFSVLEQLAFDATGWPARAVELSGATLLTGSARYPDVGMRPLPDTRDGEALELIATPFTAVPRLVDVRRLGSTRTRGFVNPAGVAVWLWRLTADTTERQPAARAGESNHYTFDALGRDIPLCVAPVPRAPGSPPAGLLDVPTPITRSSLERAVEDYYGPGRSIRIWRGSRLVPRAQVLVGDLDGWRHATPAEHVTVDPARGRIAFASGHGPNDGVWVAYSRLTVGGLGGGHYEREVVSEPGEPAPYVVAKRRQGALSDIGAALGQWARDRQEGKTGDWAVIEIRDDELYAEHLRIRLGQGERLEIRAAPGCLPIIRPVEEQTNRPDALRAEGPAKAGEGHGAGGRRGAQANGPAPVLVLDGVWVAGAPLELSGEFSGVTLRHCTLVPAAGTRRLDAPEDRGNPSLLVTAMPCPVAILSSIIGRIRIESAEVGHDPIQLAAEDSILDPSDVDGQAIEGGDRRRAFVSLSLARTTVLAGARVRQVGRIVDSLFLGPLRCERRQIGDLSFSYLPPPSRTPQRTSCQPDGVLSEVDERIARGELASSERDRARASEETRVAPRFDSVHFGDAAYARLADDAAPELTSGADDEGELGAYHELWQRLRKQDLGLRLQEYAPAGIDIDTLYAT